MNRKLSSLIAAAIFALAGAPALAIDSVAVEGGSGDSTDMGRVAIQWDWNQHWFQGKDWHLGGYWDLGIGHWRRSSTLPGQNEDITEIGLTPVFRLQQNSLTGPYFEAAIGFHVMSRTRIGDKRMG
ncbi:MAG: acyloxyacyl hydrolase, partial [Betaproteobacteria bacterium]|nr:acyloxyacyl hydrolase [Betaproteobacteria bacterium]